MTYQGRLQNAGETYNGTTNFQFLLFVSLSGGSQIGGIQNRPGLAVDDGLFQAKLDFGPEAFDGSQRFLQIWVNGAPLCPSQPINAAPVALFALDGPQNDSHGPSLAVGHSLNEANGSGAVVLGGPGHARFTKLISKNHLSS